MDYSYCVTCSYRVGRRFCKRTLKRGLSLTAARTQQAACQAREIRRFSARHGYWSSWSGRIYGIGKEQARAQAAEKT
jgi:hypothetical protein